MTRLFSVAFYLLSRSQNINECVAHEMLHGNMCKNQTGHLISAFPVFTLLCVATFLRYLHVSAVAKLDDYAQTRLKHSAELLQSNGHRKYDIVNCLCWLFSRAIPTASVFHVVCYLCHFDKLSVFFHSKFSSILSTMVEKQCNRSNKHNKVATISCSSCAIEYCTYNIFICIFHVLFLRLAYFQSLASVYSEWNIVYVCV